MIFQLLLNVFLCVFLCNALVAEQCRFEINPHGVNPFITNFILIPVINPKMPGDKQMDFSVAGGAGLKINLERKAQLLLTLEPGLKN